MLAHGFSGQWMYGFRRYLTERLQDKAAFRETRMGNYEMFLIDDTVTVKQKIEINCARSLMARPNPPECFILNLKHPAQQGAGVKPCREQQCRIVKGVLRYRTNRRCFIERRKSRYPALRDFPDFSNSAQQVEFPVSKVGTEGYAGDCFHAVIKT